MNALLNYLLRIGWCSQCHRLRPWCNIVAGSNGYRKTWCARCFLTPWDALAAAQTESEHAQ